MLAYKEKNTYQKDLLFINNNIIIKHDLGSISQI